MVQLFISQLAVALSLSTGTGILLHETKVDKLAALTIMSPAGYAQQAANLTPASLENMPHTHVESASFQSASREFHNKNPNQNPRRNEDKKYRLQKQVARGYHLFDSYHLPLDQIAA